MADQVTNYQCPACGGPLHFAPESGRLECEYCLSGFSLTEIETLYAEKEAKAAAAGQAAAEEQADGAGWDLSGLSGDWGADADGMRAYSCPSCGAELICEASTAATACPYCGNPTVVPGQFSGALRPDYVIPFKLGRDGAIRALKQRFHKKPFLPKNFTASHHLREIKGVYVPFWMFDGTAKGTAVFDARKIRVYDSGDDVVT